MCDETLSSYSAMMGSLSDDTDSVHGTSAASALSSCSRATAVSDLEQVNALLSPTSAAACRFLIFDASN